MTPTDAAPAGGCKQEPPCPALQGGLTPCVAAGILCSVPRGEALPVASTPGACACAKGRDVQRCDTPGCAEALRCEHEAGVCWAQLSAPGRRGERVGHHNRPVAADGPGKRRAGRLQRCRGAAPGGKARAAGGRRQSLPSRSAHGVGGARPGSLAGGSVTSQRCGEPPGPGRFVSRKHCARQRKRSSPHPAT